MADVGRIAVKALCYSDAENILKTEIAGNFSNLYPFTFGKKMHRTEIT